MAAAPSRARAFTLASLRIVALVRWRFGLRKPCFPTSGSPKRELLEKKAGVARLFAKHIQSIARHRQFSNFRPI